MEKKNNVLIIVVVILSLLLVVFGGYIIYDKLLNAEKETITKEEDPITEERDPITLEKGTFKNDANGGSGTVQVEGYVTTIEKNEDPYCQENCTDKINYVFFNILRTENTEFQDYINGHEGNSFVSGNAIGLGCIKNEILSYVNDSDLNGMKGYELLKDDTSKIMNSTKEKPVILELERLKFSSGSYAPSCYSHITKITVIESN